LGIFLSPWPTAPCDRRFGNNSSLASVGIEEVLDGCNKHWWEPAARHYLSDGGHLDDCYPLPERRYSEAAAWQRANGHYVPEDIS
jgi:hypothetical protein